MRGPKKPSDFLGKILKQARSVAAHADVASALERALGQDLGRHCRIAGVSSGRIVVEVDSAPLWAELQSFRREQLRQAMNEMLGNRKIAEIVFRMGATRDD